MGRSWAGSGTKPASTEAHSEASIPAKRAASSTERPAAWRVLPTHWRTNGPRPGGEQGGDHLVHRTSYSCTPYKRVCQDYADLNNIVSMCLYESRTKAPAYFGRCCSLLTGVQHLPTDRRQAGTRKHRTRDPVREDPHPGQEDTRVRHPHE